jgi:hypothetical protein
LCRASDATSLGAICHRRYHCAHRHHSIVTTTATVSAAAAAAAAATAESKFRLATIRRRRVVVWRGQVRTKSVTSDEFVEPSSGFSFPRRLDDGKQLVSASLRTLSYVFQTYVVAFYVDALPRVSGVSLDIV